MSATTIAAGEFEVPWETVDKATEDGQRYVVERTGKPALVILPLDYYEALLDRLEDLEDSLESDRIMKAIEKGEMDTVPWEEVEAKLLAREALDE